MINHFNRDKIDAGRKNTTTDNTFIIDEYRDQAHLAPRVIELFELIKYYRYKSYALHYFIYSIINNKHSLLVVRLLYENNGGIQITVIVRFKPRSMKNHRCWSPEHIWLFFKTIYLYKIHLCSTDSNFSTDLHKI